MRGGGFPPPPHPSPGDGHDASKEPPLTAPPLPDRIANALAEGERVRYHQLPGIGARPIRLVLTLGLSELWRRRTHFVVTSRRVITTRGIVSLERQVIPLWRVERVDVRRSWPAAYVFVATREGALGTQPFGPLPPPQAAEFAEAIERARAEVD